MFSISRPVHIEWSHCDPAGIVFYPNYFEMFDNGTTALFECALGMTKLQFLKHYDFLGYALAETKANFVLPMRFGDDLTAVSTMKDMRRSSFDVHHRLLKGGELAVEGFETRVWVGRDPDNPGRIKSQPIPAEVVAKLSA